MRAKAMRPMRGAPRRAHQIPLPWRPRGVYSAGLAGVVTSHPQGGAAMLHLNTGNTGFMLLCSSLVMLMTPGLAFFYGGLVGRKNVLAIMIQSFVSMGWTTVLWWVCGFSLCFSGGPGGVIGGFHALLAQR